MIGNPRKISKKEKRHALIDLAEDYDARKFCFWIARNGGLEEEDTHVSTRLRRHILMRLLDQHLGTIDGFANHSN